MTCNRELAKARNISQENIEAIDALHEMLEKFIASYTLEVPYEEARDLVRSAEFTLQKLWDFPQDECYHTWYKRLNQRWMELRWLGKTYRCAKTGVTFTVTKPYVYEKNFIGIGICGLDLGVAGGYNRIIGNLKEITHEHKDSNALHP